MPITASTSWRRSPPSTTDQIPPGLHRYTNRIVVRMTTPVPTRFSDHELHIIDQLVAQGVGSNRSEVIRRAIDHLHDSVRRAATGAAIARSYRDHPQTDDDDAFAMANAIAMTEAEPW